MMEMPSKPFSPILPPISFDPETHTFSDGETDYPSVTTVLADAGIINRSGYLPGSAQKGTDLHKLIQLYDENDLDMSTLDDEQLDFLAKWELIKQKYDIKAPRHELIVWHPYHKYAGIVDILCDDWIYEIKTGRKERWHPIQVMAYAEARIRTHGSIEGASIIYTKLPLDECVQEITREPEYFDVFLAALIVSRWRYAEGRRKSGDPSVDE